MVLLRCTVLAVVAAWAMAESRVPARAVAEHSAEHAWLAKKVLASRVVDDVTRRDGWTVRGRGEMGFPTSGGRRCLRMNVSLDGLTAQPAAAAVRTIGGEDWRPYNRLSFWLRTEASGFPVLTLIVDIQNQGKDPVAEVHQREASHNVTVPNGIWTRVVWEIPHVARDRVTSLAFRPWVNKRLPAPSDTAIFEIGKIELERVQADHYEGWNVAPGNIAFSHSGYLPEAPKTALASGIAAGEFEVLNAAGSVALRKKIIRRSTRLGEFQILDFSELRAPGNYTLRAGGVRTPPFHIGRDVWDASIAKTVNFFYAERCGMRIPGTHESCHHDWLATQGDKRIVINGGWHDAGDLSQGLINTGEATYAMYSLAAAARAAGRPWLPELLEEARWGLEWVHRVRFPGGFRVGFAAMNLWTNGIIGDEDDRTAPAYDNPNVNYIAAAAGAAAARYLAEVEPDLARRSLALAEDDWRHAIAGVETPANLNTPAFAAAPMEIAAQGIIASVELYRATRREEYARKAWELSRIVADSQQRTYVGKRFPLAGFFYTAPDRKEVFRQFHRGADHAPAVAMAMLCEAFPDHPEWMRWYAVAVRHAEYQKRSAAATAPYGVLPAYVYRDDEWQRIPENDRYGSSREAFRRQVLAGMPMGDGWYLRAFPVWYTRRGNYGVLLSQTKALAAAARLRGDRAAADLVETQLQWVVGRNPFAQSTMWGEGYRFHPQYSVSVGDIVGSLPVGMMTRDNADRPYWPASNTYVFKEVWVHPSARWLGIMADRFARPRREPFPFTVSHRTAAGGAITITARAAGRHTFSIRAENLKLEPAGPNATTWKARMESPDAPWVAVVFAEGDVTHRREVCGYREAVN